MIVRKTIKGDRAEGNRDIIDLKTNAALWWSEKLINKNALANVLPILLKTQDDFFCFIILSKKDSFQLFDLPRAAKFPANLFLKHVAVLADYGGEPIQRQGRSFEYIFPEEKGEKGKYYLNFIRKEKTYRYGFNGKEQDGDMDGNDYDYGFRIYNPQIGRFSVLTH